MADNVKINTGEDVDIATDDVSGIQYQKIKIDLGGDGVSVPLIAGSQTSANSVSVVLSSNHADVKVTLDGEAVDLGTTAQDALDAINLNTSALALETGGNLAAAAASLATLDNIVFVAGTSTYTEATSNGALLLAVRRDADTTLVNTTNEMAPLQVDANGRLKVEVFSGETLPVSLTSTTITGTVTVGTHAVTQSGTWVSTGSAAIDAAVSGNPVYTANRASSTVPTAVSASNDVQSPWLDLNGRQIVAKAPRTLVASQQTTITSSTSETTIVTAAASTFKDLTSLSITNGSASPTTVTLKDSTAGTTRAIWNISAGGGVVMTYDPPLPQASANNNWTLTCGDSVASIYVNAVFINNT